MKSMTKYSDHSTPAKFGRLMLYSILLGWISLTIGSFHDEPLFCEASISSRTLFGLTSNNSAPQFAAIDVNCRRYSTPNVLHKLSIYLIDFSAGNPGILITISSVLHLCTLYDLWINFKLYPRCIVVAIFWLVGLPGFIIMVIKRYVGAHLSVVISSIHEISAIYMFGLTSLFIINEIRLQRSYSFRRRESCRKTPMQICHR